MKLNQAFHLEKQQRKMQQEHGVQGRRTFKDKQRNNLLIAPGSFDPNYQTGNFDKIKYVNGFEINQDKIRNFIIPKKSVKQTEKTLLRIQKLTNSKSPKKV